MDHSWNKLGRKVVVSWNNLFIASVNLNQYPFSEYIYDTLELILWIDAFLKYKSISLNGNADNVRVTYCYSTQTQTQLRYHDDAARRPPHCYANKIVAVLEAQVDTVQFRGYRTPPPP